MKFKIPIDLKERRRYVCVRHPEGYPLLDKTRKTLMIIGGLKCLSYSKISVINLNREISVIRASESSVKAVLTAILILKYTECSEIDVIGLSGNLRKIKEVCSRIHDKQ
ncbi:hypothetical protein D9Q81_06020 [Candidatus Korarchaeum cryptofilum]|uniref:Uncharacterized protein n=1 Tax=Candidatus Korarchaeum cryptofilum TaxID=498846 RepID=A0A3R9PC89_9CREN|nr:hypothetical protein [Candidatus Korarchaeum cryptofilum]RSN68411.1 hypothetical protein D9Q81_06020 [Candidatus Korarchaeum cryptofilum]